MTFKESRLDNRMVAEVTRDYCDLEEIDERHIRADEEYDRIAEEGTF